MKTNEELQIDVQEAVARNDIEHVYYFPEKEDLVEAINEFVEDKQADMIAIAGSVMCDSDCSLLQ